VAEPFKNLIGAAVVHEMGSHLARVHRPFDLRRFETLALRGLDALELKARVLHVSAALEATLPTPFSAAANVLERCLAPARDDTDLGALQTNEHGLAGWAVWPMTDFVARCGLDAPSRALRALHALTQRFTAEYAIGPFLLRHRELTFATLHQWVGDPSAHVRRLVSEGSRPRLPWGMQLKFLIADPTPTLPLLEALQDDPSDYVRRSVSNHLNDIAKDHPAVVAEWLERHLPGAPRPRQVMLKHASRTLIKRFDARVLKAWGLGAPLRGDAELRVSPKRVTLGGSIELAATLRSTASKPQRLVVDYAVHHVKANGTTSPKVWKGWTVELLPKERRVLTKQHALRVVTTRRYHAGKHHVDLRINGRIVARAAFVLGMK